MMGVAAFSEKLNRVEGKVYVIEEEIQMPENGVYEALLEHDNIQVSTLTVYTGPKLTGERVQSYVLSTPSLTPWKRQIRIQTEEPVVYIAYETEGDTVEAEDINRLQEEVTLTQQGLNAEESRASQAEEQLGDSLEQMQQEMDAEKERASQAEGELDQKIESETERAAGAEQALSNKLQSESDRAKAEESAIKGDLEANRPNWDDAYGKRHAHANLSILETITQALLDAWNTVSDKVDRVEGKGLSANDFTDELLEKLNGIAAGANQYVHPTTAGNRHIPAGGAAGQVLGWSADGTAAWEDSAEYSHPNSGVAAGTYRCVTVNAQGHVTEGTNPTTLAGYGITDAAAKTHNHDTAYLKKGAVTWAELGGG